MALYVALFDPPSKSATVHTCKDVPALCTLSGQNSAYALYFQYESLNPPFEDQMNQCPLNVKLITCFNWDIRAESIKRNTTVGHCWILAGVYHIYYKSWCILNLKTDRCQWHAGKASYQSMTVSNKCLFFFLLLVQVRAGSRALYRPLSAAVVSDARRAEVSSNLYLILMYWLFYF